MMTADAQEERPSPPPSGCCWRNDNRLLVLVCLHLSRLMILNLKPETTNNQSLGLPLMKDLFPLPLGSNKLSKEKIFVQMAVWTNILSADKYFVQGLYHNDFQLVFLSIPGS